MKHTPEPWRTGNVSTTVVADSDDGLHITGATGPDALEYYGGNLIAESVSEENARRIVACVNACAGIPTEELEQKAAWKQDVRDRARKHPASNGYKWKHPDTE